MLPLCYAVPLIFILNFHPQVLVLGLLAVARAAPQDVVVDAVAAVTAEPVAVEVPAVIAETDAPVVAVAPAPAVVTPVDYAINTCRTEAEPLETQTCTPRHERVCVPADVINQVPEILGTAAIPNRP